MAGDVVNHILQFSKCVLVANLRINLRGKLVYLTSAQVSWSVGCNHYYDIATEMMSAVRNINNSLALFVWTNETCQKP